MTYRATIPAGAEGPDALLLSVILQATKDALSVNREIARDARRYFAGPMYPAHLSWLDLPADWMPAPFEKKRR